MGTIIARQTQSGETRFRAQVQITRKGERVRSESRTFSRRVLAKEWIKRREVELELLGDAVDAPGADLTLRAGIELYLEAVGDNFGRSKNASLRALADMPIADKLVPGLTPADFIAHVAWRKTQPRTTSHPRGVGPSTLNNDLIFMRLVLRYLKHARGLPLLPGVVSEAVDALRAGRVISKSSQRERRPTHDEMQRLDAYLWRRWSDGRLQIPLWHLMWFAIYSGRRQEELGRLPRAGFDAGHEVYQIEDGIKAPTGRKHKNFEARLPTAGWEVVERVVRDLPGKSGYLFSINAKSVSTAWARSCRMLGIVDLRFHDLRHEALSRLGEDGLTVPQIQQVSLHESWDSLRRYVNMPAHRQARLEFVESVGYGQ